MARKLQVEIIGDASSLERAFGKASKSGSGLGSTLKTLGKVAAVGVGAAFAGMAAVVKVGFDELAEGQKVAAQTAATLKSTGGVANVTAKQIATLAEEQSKLTGIDDELIQSSENLLLTFKNVRNEVGKGNDVFNQATVAALDLSTAGFGSVESASKMMGKALNDPIKGMTALGRAGVTFSEEQKKAISALVKTGDLLGAQKVILKEVESQVGGSAKAYGETLPGQLNKLKNSFEEAASGVAVALLPALTKGVELLAQLVPKIGEFGAKLTEAIGPHITRAIDQLGPAFERAKTSVINLLTTLRDILPVVQQIVTVGLDIAFSSWGQTAGVAVIAMIAFRNAANALIARLIALKAAATGATLATLISPLGILTAGVGLLAAGFYKTQIASDAATSAFQRQRDAVLALREAANESVHADLRLRDAKIGLRQAALNVSTAMKERNRLEGEGKKGTDEYKQSTLNIQSALANRKRAEQELKEATQGVTEAAGKQSGAIKELSQSGRAATADASKLAAGLSRVGEEASKHTVVAKYATQMDTLANKADKVAAATAKSNPEIAEAARNFAATARAAANYARRTGEIPPALSAVGPAAKTAGASVGASFGQGLAAGIASQVSNIAAAAARSVTAAENAARTAAQAKSPSKTWQKLGEDMQAGLIIGFITKGTTFSQQAASHLSTALKSAREVFLTASHVLGTDGALAIVNGFRQQQPSLAQQMKTALQDATKAALEASRQAVLDAKGAFSSAFDSLVQTALSAFDKISSQFQTKTEKLIAQQDAARAKAERERTLVEAETRLTTAIEGGDPEAIKAAEQQLADAKFAIQRAADEKAAAAERVEYEARRERQRVNLEKQLARLQQNYLNQEISTKQFHTRLIGIFKSFEIPLGKAANKLGAALATGLTESFNQVDIAAKNLAATIVKRLSEITVKVDIELQDIKGGRGPAGRQHGGPVRAGSPYVVGEAGPELFIPRGSGTIVANGNRATAAGGIVNINFYGPTVGTSREFEDTVRRALYDVNRRNPGIGFAT